MLANSALCGGAGLVYGAGGRPHAPASICGAPVAYDANGNTLSYDPDGPGPLERRSIAYDGENRPVSVTAFGHVASFDYGPDGARAGKSDLCRPLTSNGAVAFGTHTAMYFFAPLRVMSDRDRTSSMWPPSAA